MGASFFEVSGLNQFYSGSHILRDISFNLRPGKITCLLGRNGVGKSTLLKVVMGLIAPRSGRLQWQGRDLLGLAPHQRVAQGLAYVPQGREIFNRLTVLENLLSGLAVLKGPDGSRVPPWVMQWFPVLEQMKHRRGGDLSGGQQQQLAIARALLSRPKLLLLDEPTEGIQPSIIKDIGRVIRRLATEQQMSILLVEQYYDFAASLADDYLVMSRGQIIARGQGHDMAKDGVRMMITV
ncbi:MAG: urea ABC transporter ATP-binding subunit UrtE [Betaproteobacteria bacterium]|nr:urea ABC transporter ATP-binding subunit UrtE [Betaproteobacteria bacterium]NBT99456.1 urea ABC transporter ATP-binding subunit UrtE [Betaproteobacteria bacterium]NDE32220.1 urea ABC transporter ATP-binding subunit UrtE [Betaproteobacteria bacterium]